MKNVFKKNVNFFFDINLWVVTGLIWISEELM